MYITLYEVREFIGNGYSKRLSEKLRSEKAALAIQKKMIRKGRDIIIVPLRISKKKICRKFDIDQVQA